MYICTFNVPYYEFNVYFNGNKLNSTLPLNNSPLIYHTSTEVQDLLVIVIVVCCVNLAVYGANIIPQH